MAVPQAFLAIWTDPDRPLIFEDNSLETSNRRTCHRRRHRLLRTIDETLDSLSLLVCTNEMHLESIAWLNACCLQLGPVLHGPLRCSQQGFDSLAWAVR